MSSVTHLPQREGLLASEVLEAVPGLTYRQLDFWNRSGRIQPLPGKQGSGHYHRYTAEQVRIIGRMHRLVMLGFTLDAAHHIATDRKTAEQALRGVSTIVIEHTFNDEEEEDLPDTADKDQKLDGSSHGIFLARTLQAKNDSGDPA